MKLLASGFYTEGYNLDQMRCLDLSRACASGCHGHELYYMYSFLYAMNRGWLWKREDTIEYILRPLGLRQIRQSVNTKEELIEMIHSQIDKGNPLLLCLAYDTIFFNSSYMEEDKAKHFLLINGYDGEKNLLNLKDYLFAREFVKTAIPRNVEVFIDFRLKEEHVVQMWEDSKKEGINEAVIISREDNQQIQNYQGLIGYFLKKVQIGREVYSCYNQMEGIDYADVMKRLYNSIDMILDVVKRAVREEKCLLFNLKEEEIEGLMHTCLSKRKDLTNRVLRELIHNHKISEGLIGEMVGNDGEIYKIMQLVYKQVRLYQKMQKRKNIASGARVYADSEGENARAAYAVDSNGDNTCWLADYHYEEHWIVVDLEEVRPIDTVIVGHHPTKKNLVTYDFRIEGSLDTQNWSVLGIFKGNQRHRTRVSFPSAYYRYIRVYIEKANVINENAARIYSIEVYGE